MSRAANLAWKSGATAAIAGAWVVGLFHFDRRFHVGVHPSTVISVLFLIVVCSANYWGLVPSLTGSLAAAWAFVTYFQPPIGLFATTPQGWIATGAFVGASLLVSQLSVAARRHAQEANRRSQESACIEQFGRGLLACSSSPIVASTAVNQAVALLGARAAVFDLVSRGGSYRSGPEGWTWSVPEQLRQEALARRDWIRHAESGAVVIPLVLDRTPVAFFGMRGMAVSDTVLTAISRQLLMTLGRVLAAEELLHLAGEIQMGLLPKKFPPFPMVSEVDLYATIAPALEVGGDFYHFFLLDPEHLCLVIGDVSDKGIPAALFMAMTLTAFVVSAKDERRALPESVRLLNRYLCDNNESQMFVTLYAGVLDLRTGVLEYCDGGHEPPFLLRCGQPPQLVRKEGGMALGIDPDYPYQSARLRLAPGDTLFLYTDGVNEAMNGAGAMFRTDGIATVLATATEDNCEHLCATVMQQVGQFVEGASQSDDITMLAISYRGPAQANYRGIARSA